LDLIGAYLMTLVTSDVRARLIDTMPVDASECCTATPAMRHTRYDDGSRQGITVRHLDRYVVA